MAKATDMGQLLEIGAMAGRLRFEADDRDVTVHGPDVAKLETMTAGAIGGLAWGVQAVGHLMAHADLAELGTESATGLGWLLCGLGEVIGELNTLRTDCGFDVAETGLTDMAQAKAGGQ